MLANLKERVVHLRTKNARQFALEVYVFYMHILDRMAFAFLGMPERKAFGDALIYCIANSFGTGEEVNQLRDTYNKRQVQYELQGIVGDRWTATEGDISLGIQQGALRYNGRQ